MAIHKFMRIMHEGETIPMYGDGTSGRDYTYIGDIVDGVVRSIDRIDGYRIYNLGGDEVILLRDLIQAIGEVTGIEPKVEQLPMQPGDVMVTNADLTRARAELGYEPQTSLRKGLENMWAWYLEEKAGDQ
jgi:nucleoside-diphosphate-sugar epimerase